MCEIIEISKIIEQKAELVDDMTNICLTSSHCRVSSLIESKDVRWMQCMMANEYDFPIDFVYESGF